MLFVYSAIVWLVPTDDMCNEWTSLDDGPDDTGQQQSVHGLHGQNVYIVHCKFVAA